MKKVAILAAPGFEEIELMAPLDILRRLNMDVVLAGVQSDKVVSTHEVTVSTDTMLDKLHADKLDALILPGGAGSWVLRDTPEVIHLVKKMHEAGKLVAAICAAPIVLAKAGLVKDRNVTAYPAQDVYRELNEAGAHIVKDENVVLDGNMLTANGPGVPCGTTSGGNAGQRKNCSGRGNPAKGGKKPGPIGPDGRGRSPRPPVPATFSSRKAELPGLPETP
jgi:DJ-1 family protein